MTDKPLRPQLNIRLDKHPSLLDDIKQAAGDRNTTASQFVLDAIKSALGKPTTTPTEPPSLELIKAEIDKIVDTKLDKRLEDFERRLLAEFRRNDRQSPQEELIEEIPEIRPEVRPDYQAVRDRILRSLTRGRGSFASTSPQYRAASRALDRFIAQIANEESQAQSAVE